MQRPDPQPAPTRLHPIRVLLVSADRRFLRMASVVLGRAGCTTASVETPRRVAEAVARHGANVLVVDATRRVGATAAALGALEGLGARVAVVTVCEDPGAATNGLRMLSKWNVGKLVGAVESAYAEVGRSSDVVA